MPNPGPPKPGPPNPGPPNPGPLGTGLLLLADSRLPAGGHAHSGGTERAIAAGAVHDVPSLERFLRGRLHTAGALAAALAAAAAHHAATLSTGAPAGPEGSGTGDGGWAGLETEADARTASPAQREASRTQGRLLLRVARRIWPSPVLDGLAGEVPSPHHPIVLGAAAHAAGATAGEAALAAAYHAVSGPATAAVRLLGLDPVAVHATLAALAPDLAAVAARPAAPPAWAELPAPSAPALDLLAEQHVRAETRLFVS
ncbi:urease accessory protein UreF [Actinomadura sp. ATCC 31491]|uniref:Urease accessory protein UreF n=1 Tax=Actinomadura luzonensis TaxID=2805427 RepID=A0ABT0G6T9_9ACTN|nr:urease accessory UreF family protein [Actinomadura luzonensis]MCK2219930.1 urease accessory protein UreF [Actinomadura luzonensis]